MCLVFGAFNLEEVLDMLKQTHNQMVLTFQRAKVNEVPRCHEL